MSKIKTYEESTFAIDMIADAYKIKDPFTISQKVKEDLNIEVSVSEIIDYISADEDFEKENWTINSKEIFNE